MFSHELTLSSRRLRVRRRTSARIASAAAIAAGVAMILPATAGAATSPIGLGTADSFAILAGSGITNTGPTTVTGDIGSFPTPTETGLGTMTIIGVDHAGDAVTQQAKNDLVTAYNVAAGAGPPDLVATELGGRTLTSGVYNGATLGITGTLTLDTEGDPNAVFVFQTASTLITASNSSVVVLDGALACNVFWQVGSSATLGTGSALIGTVLASASITATTGATVQGRLLALDGAVTLDTNTITRIGCAATAPSTTAPSTTAPPTTATTVPSTPTSTVAPTTLVSSPSSTPANSVVATPTAGSTPGATPGSPSTPGGGTDLTSSPQRPPLPFTGSDPRLLLAAGGLALTLGVLLRGASTRVADWHDATSCKRTRSAR